MIEDYKIYKLKSFLFDKYKIDVRMENDGRISFPNYDERKRSFLEARDLLLEIVNAIERIKTPTLNSSKILTLNICYDEVAFNNTDIIDSLFHEVKSHYNGSIVKLNKSMGGINTNG